MEYKKLEDAGDIRGKKVLLRLDLNVPIEKGVVRDSFRITQSLPTISLLKEKGAKILILAHIENEEGATLKPVADFIAKTIPLSFVSSIDEAEKKLAHAHEGDVILLENLRSFGEGEKKNVKVFAEVLSALGDIYVNDAFSVSHRAHSSVVGIPTFIPGYMGPLLASEVEHLSKAFSPQHPFLFILGGAKFDTKLPLVSKFLSIADTVFIGGALAHDVFKARGLSVGKSLVSEGVDVSTLATNPKILLPVDVIVKNGDTVTTKNPRDIAPDDVIVDAGAKTVLLLKDVASQSAFILWNGPLGNYEQGFTDGTSGVAKAIAESGKETIIGGGDTIASVAFLGLNNKFSFISTGGGAMLDFLAHETLPGLLPLKK